MLSINNISKSFGDTRVIAGFSLNIFQGEFITLLGPSGCGKTTLLRLIAGFEKPDNGTILLDDSDISHLPPEKRLVNTVFQSYALFPHMTVFDNISFGLRLKKTNPDIVIDKVNKALAQTRLTGLAQRFPHQLSGGQQQRVAMARAIINKPRILLLDEPLSALDARLRTEMQIELKRLQRELNITTVLVTHEQDEALSLSDRVVVMDQGKIAQIGDPREIYENPNSLYVAKFIGEINILPAVIEDSTHNMNISIKVMDKIISLKSTQSFPPGSKIVVLLRPEDLRLTGDIQDDMPQFKGTIIERRYRGATLDTTIRLDYGPVVQACEFFDEDDPDFDYSIGERVSVSWVRGWEVLLADEE